MKRTTKKQGGKGKVKYWTCPVCEANFPGPAGAPLILPTHRGIRDTVCPGSNRPAE